MTTEPKPDPDSHIAILDGLRGAMALWVFYGHLQITCIGTVPRFGHPAGAVDMFMILSGFLMTYHWIGRKDRYENTAHQSIDFYFRRYFRIAPLYYLLFTVGFLGSGWFSNPSPAPPPEALAHFNTTPATGSRTIDAFLHYTFLFGALPRYVETNILPDWSIGLEMQFYALFPLLLLALSKWGALTTIFLTIVATYVTRHGFSLGDDPAGPWGNFPQPGMIFFKLDIFMTGICLAFHWRERATRNAIPWLLLAVTCILQATIQVKGLVFGTLLLLHFDPTRRDLSHRALTGRIARFAGDTSYSVYLLHMLLLQPTLRLLSQHAWFSNLSPVGRMSVTFIIVAIPLYSLAALLHRFVELPGISIGRRFSTKFAARLGYVKQRPSGTFGA